jgi:hypothetical protein
MDLRGGKIIRDFVEIPNDFIDKRFMIVLLKDAHVSFAASGNDDEGIASHILYS